MYQCICVLCVINLFCALRTKRPGHNPYGNTSGDVYKRRADFQQIDTVSDRTRLCRRRYNDKWLFCVHRIVRMTNGAATRTSYPFSRSLCVPQTSSLYTTYKNAIFFPTLFHHITIYTIVNDPGCDCA